MKLDPPNDRIGKAVDSAFDKLNIHFDSDWVPERQGRSRWILWTSLVATSAAAAVATLFIPWSGPLTHQKVSVNVPVSASPSLPQNVTQTLKLFHASDIQVEGMVPVYASYPVVNPTAQAYAFRGNFRVHAVMGNYLSLVVNRSHEVSHGVLFSSQRPVFAFQIKSLAPSSPTLGNSELITTAPKPSPLAGTWSQAGTSQLGSFTASGPMVYATHEGYWTSISGQGNGLWQNPPVGSPASETASIAGLPSAPQHALLVEEASSGLSRGFVTPNAGRSWKPWTLGSVQFSNLVSMNHRYWAIINGSLRESPGGSRWQSILSVNPSKWQVQDFAVNPAHPNMLVASLVPIAGSGIGPVLTTTDNGRHWHEILNFPNLGVAPTDMAVLPNGDVSALVSLQKPVLVEYHQSTKQWQMIAVPRQAMGVGSGQLTAAPNGNLVYAAPGGNIYVWNHSLASWQVINAPANAPLNSSPANPLEAIGDQEVMAVYPSGWYYFVAAPAATKQ